MTSNVFYLSKSEFMIDLGKSVLINSYLVICVFINKSDNIITPVGGGAAFFEFKSSLAALAALLEQKLQCFKYTLMQIYT